VIAIAGSLSSVLVTWGMVTAKVKRLEDDLREVTSLIRQIELSGNARQLESEKRLAGLNDSFVTLEHFRETMSQFRADYKELKDDIKQVLRLLNEPARHN